MKSVFSILFLLSIWSITIASSKKCYCNSGCPYKYFSSKTPYDDVRGDIRDAPELEGCTPVSVWFLSRHGSRNPGDDNTVAMKAAAVALKEQILSAYAEGRGKMCSQDIENLRNWEWDDTLDNTTFYLTALGYDELLQFGKRIKTKYSTLMSHNPEEYYFRPTTEQRTVMSAQAFVQGLTEGQNINVIIDKPRKEDNVIRPYRMCPKYEKIRNTYPTPKDRVEEFYTSAEFQILILGLRERLGIKDELSPETVSALYDLCRFYRSFEMVRRSPWCSIFRHADLVTLEYVEDINHYYKNGYGSEINCKLGATAAKDLYENFHAIYNGTTGKTIVGYFTHDTMMEMVYCSLGMFKDDFNLTSQIRRHPRKWRTSVMSPFATNLMVVMHKCEENNVVTHKVQFFVNEQEYFMCLNSPCSWEEFEKKFELFVDTSLDFCELSSDKGNEKNQV